MKLSGSRVPHLAYALAEKRQLSSSGTVLRRSLPYGNTQLQPQQTRLARSTSTVQKPPSRSPSSSTAARPIQARARPIRSEPAPVLAAGAEASNEYYDPSKDPKKVKNYLIYTSAFAALTGTYIFYVITSYRRDLKKYNESSDKLVQDQDVSDRWCDEKRNFDYEVEGQEKISWMKGKRRRLIREAYGDVLEVSVGTGRNMDQYDTRPFSDIENSSFGRSTRHMISSLTFNDQSPVMIGKAEQKWADDQKSRTPRDRFVGQVNFITGDARVPGVIPRPEGGYDTIVQSMGICSMAEPVKFLRLLGRLVRQPGEPVINSGPEKIRKEESADGKGGRIFLLEHGRAFDWFGWLNQYLDNSATMHANRYGCWYNKDIEKIVQDSGLIIERVKRHYFGTVFEIVLRPAPGLLPGEEVLQKEIVVPVSEPKQTTASSSLSWLK